MMPTDSSPAAVPQPSRLEARLTVLRFDEQRSREQAIEARERGDREQMMVKLRSVAIARTLIEHLTNPPLNCRCDEH